MDVMYCNNNFFYCLPYLPYSLSYLSCNYIPNIYPYANFYAINIVNQLRFNYYSIKYGHKLFFYVLKKKYFCGIFPVGLRLQNTNQSLGAKLNVRNTLLQI